MVGGGCVVWDAANVGLTGRWVDADGHTCGLGGPAEMGDAVPGDPSGRSSSGGVGVEVLSRNPQLTARRWTMGGEMAAKVTRVANFGSTVGLTHLLHLITTLLAHQKLATLSSNKPRLKGKMRMMDCCSREGKDWKMNGANRTMNEMRVATPIFVS